jgi:hypothetical protein
MYFRPMRFIRYNYNNGHVFGFALDSMYSFEDDGENTKVLLTNGVELTLIIDIDSFCAKVFSDELGEDGLVDIDEPETPPEADIKDFI